MGLKFIGDHNEPVSPEALDQMQRVGGIWYVYQNHDLGSHDVGALKFLKVGEDCTFKSPPDRYPDFEGAINWRYMNTDCVVDLATGQIVDIVSKEVQETGSNN